MKDAVYLIADAWGVLRMTKREPSLNRGEVAIKVRVSVPENVFKNPIINADLAVPEDRVIQPEASLSVDPSTDQGEG